MRKKILHSCPVLFLIICLFSLTVCKQQSTTPDTSDLTRPVIWLNLFQMTFTAYETGPNPSSQIVQIKNSGQQTLDYTLSADVDWISFSPEGGSSTGQTTEHTISVNKNGLSAQNEDYVATITITSSQAYNNPQALGVNLALSKEPPPEIWINTQQLSFDAQEGGTNPDSQTLSIRNNGSASLNYQIQDSAPWLNVNPSSGTVKTGKKTHTVSVDIGGLGEGSYSGKITISDPDASNSPQQVDVTLNITKKPPVLPPSTKNEIGLSISPRQGGTGTLVTITIFIDGNTSQISSFGFELNFNPSIFQYQNTSKGTLTGNWIQVDGNEIASGIVRVGGFTTPGSISIGSQGSIAVVRFQVRPSSSQTTQINLSNLMDNIAGMTINPGSVTFTRN